MTPQESKERTTRILSKLREGLNSHHSFHRPLLDGLKGLQSEDEEEEGTESLKKRSIRMKDRHRLSKKACLQAEATYGKHEEMDKSDESDKDEKEDGEMSDEDEREDGETDDDDEEVEWYEESDEVDEDEGEVGVEMETRTEVEIAKAELEANKDIAKANKMMKDIQSGKYIDAYVAKIKRFIASDDTIGVIHLGHTTSAEARTILDNMPVVILALEEELVGYILTHRNSRQEHQTLKFQFDAIAKLLAKFDSQAKVDDGMAVSHSNAFPNKVKEGSERVYNLSIFNMRGHKETPLKFSQKTFKGSLSYDLDLGKNSPTCTLLGEVSAYGYSTLQTPALVDELNAVFFPDSVKRKKRVAYLIHKHQRQISEGSIISFFAARIVHEVEVAPEFLQSNKQFKERVVEVFGSYESVYKKSIETDKKIKEAQKNMEEVEAKVMAEKEEKAIRAKKQNK
ncbi:hypothetical protein HDU77_001123 [Chytriomyces hyalinus]|nr:hypothetical protein HDU77_001123 [Chytriomyces hyalinus]